MLSAAVSPGGRGTPYPAFAPLQRPDPVPRRPGIVCQSSCFPARGMHHRQTIGEAGDVLAHGSDANAYVSGLYSKDHQTKARNHLEFGLALD